MKMDGASQEVLQQTTGMRPMQTATGIEAFYRSLALPYDQIFVAEGDRSQMRRALLDGNSPPQPAQRERDSAKPEKRRGGAKRRGGVGQRNDFLDQHHPSRGLAASTFPSSAEEGSLQEKTQDYLRKQ